ncbi:MAG TPA: FG-GAP-like repeat-containing protein [Pyrinomonadaceae bacterium]
MFFYSLAPSKSALLALIFFFGTFSYTASSQSRPEMPPDPFGFSAERVTPLMTTSVQRSLEAADGDLDPTFAPTFDFANGFVYAVEELSSGKVLVGGAFKSINGHASSGVMRLNADRSVDTSFVATIRGTVHRIAVQPDGKILIGGAFSAFGSSTARSHVARLNADGSLDTTFDAGSGPDTFVRDIALQPDGKLLIAGDFVSVNGSLRNAIARLNTDGSVDSGFTSPVVPSLPTGSLASAVGLQPDGKIIVGGVMHLGGDPQVRWVLRLNTDGTPDNTFTSPSMNSNTWELAVQADGKIVLAGFFTTVNSISRPRIARLNADGTLDGSFTPGTGANSSALQVRVLPGGKVLVSGTFSSFNGTARGGLAQLNDDGTLDGSFAPAGTTIGTVYAVTPTASGDYYAGGSFTRFSGSDRNTLVALNPDGSVDGDFVANSLNFASVRASLSLPDGKILVGGFFNRLNGTSVNSILRLTSGGAVDGTFSTGVSITGTIFRIVAQPDGKFLIAGSGIRVNNGPSQTMVRLNADGTPDGSFTLATITQIVIGNAAAVQPDGKILFSYTTTSADPTINTALIRLNSDGSIDGSFTLVQRHIEAITVLPNGQIMAAGSFSFSYVSSGGGGTEPHNGLIRINSDGSHDRTFRSALAAQPFYVTAAYAMHVQPDGRILVGGRLYTAGSPTTPVGIARLNSTGTLDGTFEVNPIMTDFGVANVFSIAPTSDAKILVGGYFVNYDGSGQTNIARLGTNGAADATFAANTDSSVSTISVQASGSIVIGGNFEHVNGVSRPALARLLNESQPQNRAPFDFDGDGKTDIGIFRPAVGEWWYQRSSDAVVPAFQFGNASDRIAPTDYTGDGKTDIAFFRASTGEWYILRSEDSSFFSFPFGANGDIPAPADYDADGKADPAVFRPSSATWFIQRSGDNGTTIQQFGANGDQPVAADYDGDGKADLAIYRPSVGEWWLNRSTAGVIAYGFGNSTDKAVPGDYTGDGKSDVAFWRPSTGEWYILRSEDTSFYSAPFGTTGDIPAPGDYDGDGKFDVTVFRPSAATWFSQRTTAGTLIQQFGANGDTPIPNAFIP